MERTDSSWNELASWRGLRLGPVELLAEVDSTNLEALRRIDRGAASPGATLVARRQTSGHGSRGRAWHDATERSLALTCVLAWTSATPLALATWLGVVAVADALDELDVAAQVKWPNDALVHGRKIAGVLAEVRSARDASWIALGIGLNVGHREGDFPPALATPPTSLALEGRTADVPGAALLLLRALDRRLQELATDRGAAIRDAFLDRLGLLRTPVAAALPERTVEGPLLGLDLDGTLRIGGERLPGGHVTALRRL